MLGDAKHECIIWNKSWQNMSPEPMAPDSDLSSPTASMVIDRMDEVLGREKAAVLASLYGLSRASSREDVFKCLERMTTHGIFSIPTSFAAHAGAESDARTEIWAYHFDVPSPFDNAWGGLAHHSFDNIPVWGVLRHAVPEAYRRAGDIMQEAWIRFAHGEEPWERFNKGKRWMIFRLEDSQIATESRDEDRVYDIWEQLDERGLVGDLFDLSVELCLRRRELLKAS